MALPPEYSLDLLLLCFPYLLGFSCLLLYVLSPPLGERERHPVHRLPAFTLWLTSEDYPSVAVIGGAVLSCSLYFLSAPLVCGTRRLWTPAAWH